MNCNTGEIRNISPEMVEQFIKRGFTPVPDEHLTEAQEILDGEDCAVADMTADTPRVNWAKSHQGRKKAKSKRNMAKNSRKRNRKRRTSHD